MNKKRKQITVIGEYWDFHPVLRMFGELYDSRFVSFYKPWLKSPSADNVINFNEKYVTIFLWPYKIIRRSIKLIWQIIHFDPDVVISHHDDANISILPVAFVFKKILHRKFPKFIMWIRNNPMQTYQVGFYSKMVKIFYEYAYVISDKIVVQCESNREIIESNFPKLKSKLEIIPNFYDIAGCRLNANQQLDTKYEQYFSNNSFVFLNIGRLTKQKCQWSLIRSFYAVAKKNENARLLIIGEGEYRDRLVDLISALCLQNQVFLLGHQANPFVFMKRAQCLVATSLWEGFPNVIVESLIFNIPIISTDCKTGPREILCPEININEIISYPYYGKFGVLIEPLQEKECFVGIEGSDLNKEEKKLSDLLLYFFENQEIENQYSKVDERVSDFDVNNANALAIIKNI